MNIRAAGPRDLPGILEISNWAALHTAANFAVEPETLQSWQESWEHTHRRFPWLVAAGSGSGSGDGEVIGFAKASPWKGRCAYEWTAEVSVYVDQAHHGRGVGRALYGSLLPQLDAQGYRTLLAGITVPNDASVRLHESFGFRRCATFERVGWKFGRWHTVAYWQRNVGGDGAPGKIRSVTSVAEPSAHP